MCNNKQCASYLKKNEAYKRCLTELRKKWETYGKTAGRITLKNASQEEKRAIGGIVGKLFLEETIQFSFAEFEQGLQQTRFAPINMKKVLDAYFGEEVLTKQEQKSLVKNEKELFLQCIYEEFQRKTSQRNPYFLQLAEVVSETEETYFGETMSEHSKKNHNVSLEHKKLDSFVHENTYLNKENLDSENRNSEYFNKENLDSKNRNSKYLNKKNLDSKNRNNKYLNKKNLDSENQNSKYFNNEQTSVAVEWFHALMNEKKYGYQILIKEYGNNVETAMQIAKNTGNALLRLEEMTEQETCPLAVFAAEVSGNPHFFDRGTTASQLLVHGICFWKNCSIPVSAYEWRELFTNVGILCDNIASMFHAVGLHLETKEGLHPAYEAFCNRTEPFVVTSENLKYITGAKASGNCVYIVENEMVFLYLTEYIKDKDITLLCTSGQLRVAAFQVISLLIKSGVTIYYGGDLDPEGICIADRLWQTYGDVIQMWRMSPKDYWAGISQEVLNDTRLAKMEHIKNPFLQQTAKCIYVRKKAAYQENLLEKLLEDLTIEQTMT